MRTNNPSRSVGASWRALLIGALLVPVNCYWVMNSLDQGYPTTVSLFYNVIFCLFILTGLNIGLTKISPRFVYIKPEEITTFAYRFMGAFLYEFLKRRGEEPDEDFEQLLSLGIGHAPRTASAILRLRQTMDTMPKESVFASVLDLPLKLRQETGLYPIILFDEFQNFASYRLDSPLHTLP